MLKLTHHHCPPPPPAPQSPSPTLLHRVNASLSKAKDRNRHKSLSKRLNDVPTSFPPFLHSSISSLRGCITNHMNTLQLNSAIPLHVL